MGLKLFRGETVFVDTAPLIYFFEEKEPYVDRLADFFDEVTQLDIQLVTSMVTYIEILTLPEKLGDERLAAKYREFLTNSEQLSIYPLNIAVADAAVRLRASAGVKTPDAIQLAVAQVCGVDHVLTNDRKWRELSSFNVVLVDEL
jgi:predicted nucleic acid-binding protein